MEAVLKNIFLPILIVLGALTSCICSICFYHCLKYIREKREAVQNVRQNDYDFASSKNEEEKETLIKKSSLKRNLSMTSSISSFTYEASEYNTVEDIRDILHLRGLVVTAAYNCDKRYLQVDVSTCILYPLPKGVSNRFMLQYKLSFSIPNTDKYESEFKPMRHHIRFDEKYRIYRSLSDVEDAEMMFDILVLEPSYELKLLWTVQYLLKPSNVLSSESDYSVIPEDSEPGFDKICKVDSLRQVEGDTKCPKILVSLCYKPTSGRIYMRLIQGQDFPSSAHDMRLRVTILQTKYGSVRSHLTSVMENCTDPEIQEAFTLGLSFAYIQTSIVIITLLYGYNMKSFAPIAEAKIGSFVDSESGRQHWNDMLSSVRNDIEMWHELDSEL